MAIYKRYNTRRKKVSARVVVPLVCIAIVFALTVWLGAYLGNKASGGEPLYTGKATDDGESGVLAPLSEKSIHGEYVLPDDLAEYVAPDEDTWASTWLYANGEACFATDTDAMLGRDTHGLPTLASFDIDCGTTGLFEVTCVFADDLVKDIITEYERALICEFLASGLDEAVLVFEDVTEENYKDALDFAENISGAAVVCVPYEMLRSQEFFSAAAEKGLTLALMADGVKAAELESDIETYAFYFTKYNLRIVLSNNDTELAEILSANTLLNYQFKGEA
ncbi:MAG: hypothetical protein IJ002_01880 [Clostridia bacterium]|nr:hypothetical protein [Clostridia bacterium]